MAMRDRFRLVLISAALAAIAAPAAVPQPANAAAETAAREAASPVGSLTAASAIQPGSVNRTSINLTATYAVDASIAVGTGVIRVATTISARNDSGADIDRIELNTIATRLGGIAITAASVDGTAVTPSLVDQTIRVPLGGVLPSGETVQVYLAYRATLRTSLYGSSWMFTRYGGTLSLYRWIPWVSLARPFDRPNHGDPFITGTSPEVKVHLTLDKPRVVAAAVKWLPTGASKTWSFTVRNVRDVSLVAAPDFTVSTRYVDGVQIRAYSRPGGVLGGKLADLTKLAVHREATQLGTAYPWPSLFAVETAGGYGLESPGLIWIPKNTLSGNLSYLVHHEVAHQWFYGLVGNDQQREPFADEAAADLLARTVLGTLRTSRCALDDLDRTITGYSSSCYYETIYIQGGKLLNLLRQKMGTTLFWATMRSYVEANRFQIGSTKDLLDTLRAASPVDLTPSLEARFPSLY
ncbi:MAG TPA: hypothetical protein VFM38_11790 [Candidatus Limnocylindrales bacterium]|nr:hypothetical protein [Candidatus Limnocylindrales bacterium]